MKLQVEENGGPFYDGGKAPAQEAADAIAPEAVVVNLPAADETSPPDTSADSPPATGADSLPTTDADSPPITDAEKLPDLTIALDRRFNDVTRREDFRLLHRIGYNDDAPDIGVGEILVPADLENWTTDLASVPAFLTWLVPKTGAHLPAAILHDGLVLNKDEPASYIAERWIYRDEADRIFRDAMAKTGTGLIRRWMVWAAVTAATMHHGRQVDWSPIKKWHYRIALYGTGILIAVLGAWSTLDLLNTLGLPSIRSISGVPWMGERPLQALVGGLAGAVAIPLMVGVTWGKFRIAGWIIGPLVALIVPAVIPILFIGGIYIGVDRLQRWRPRLAEALGVLFIALAFIVFAVSWWIA